MARFNTIVRFRCPEALRDRVKEVARRRLTSMSAVIREATANSVGLEQYVEELEREEESVYD